MAIYRCAIEKLKVNGIDQGRRWRNIYDIEADSYESALAAADVIRIQEAFFHMTNVQFTKVTAHLVTEPARRVGAELILSGELGAQESTDPELPGWNVVRADFTDIGIGRPERKYYRPYLHTGHVTGAVLEPTYYAIVQSAVSEIGSLTNFVGPSGEQHAAGTTQSLIAMRQLHWHRRRRPGFVRGYVPV